MNKPYILISSCLIGLYCRYNGKTKLVKKLIKLVEQGKAIYICPEQVGGLSTPRVPAEIEFGKSATDVLVGKAKVIGKDCSNLTKEFVKGATETLNLCQKYGIKIAILSENSPSCGSVEIYDGTFTGNKILGHGITTELLLQNGILVYSEENYPDNLLYT